MLSEWSPAKLISVDGLLTIDTLNLKMSVRSSSVKMVSRSIKRLDNKNLNFCKNKSDIGAPGKFVLVIWLYKLEPAEKMKRPVNRAARRIWVFKCKTITKTVAPVQSAYVPYVIGSRRNVLIKICHPHFNTLITESVCHHAFEAHESYQMGYNPPTSKRFSTQRMEWRITCYKVRQNLKALY